MGMWLANQRQRGDRLDPTQLEALAGLGIGWARWELSGAAYDAGVGGAVAQRSTRGLRKREDAGSNPVGSDRK
ncbi:hypothetical protein AB0469_37145 [Streptomyces sp. NPDC093801]|uniref:hypothetical protein n=1 Tax=Streptomyces sp. NPDC093801 TaxID=3155203 RepID=UPI00344E795F